jgi:hypothetical protein
MMGVSVTKLKEARFEVLTVTSILILFFRVATPCTLVGRYNISEKHTDLNMETAYFSETLASTYETTRRHNPEQHHQGKTKFV